MLAAAAPYVRDVVVTGHDRPDVGVLLVVDVDALRVLAPQLDAAAAPEALAMHPEIVAHFGSVLRELNTGSRHASERVARALLFVEPLSMDRGEVTDKGSVNQRAVLAARSDLVARVHAATATGADPRVLLAK
jgi:feruloyl-CoA synthase